MKLPENVSESLKRRNPDLYGLPVGAVGSAKPEQNAAPVLGLKLPRKRTRKDGAIAIITLISCRKSCLDDDNFAGGAKPLRDLIAEILGIDDGDGWIKWKYAQVEVEGNEGTIVRIDLL